MTARPALSHSARACSLGLILLVSCGAGVPVPSSEPDAKTPADAPLVAAQPGAWFDAQGNLTVVGAGRRLRLILSAPVSACAPAFNTEGSAAELAVRASLPFHVLAEACRETHPSILLAAESATASPSELELSYHEVTRCAASELGVTEGWVPHVVAHGEPCSAALGLGWRLPTQAELSGLTADDRKAIAGALFDTDEATAFDGLLIYARSANGKLELSTLSPNAAERAPPLDDDRRPLFGAALRCVRDTVSPAESARAPLPVLPGAGACLRQQRASRGVAAAPLRPAHPPELEKLKSWMNAAEHKPGLLNNEVELRELMQLLAAPALDGLAREERAERALTDRYSELAEGLDDPEISETERQRRRAEFDSLRKRLSGQIVRSAETSGAGRTELGAVLFQLRLLIEHHQVALKGKKHPLDYTPVLRRIRELEDGKAAAP